MIELHDVAGSSNLQDLLSCSQWFSNNMLMLKKYQRYILINIAGGWVKIISKKFSKSFRIFHELLSFRALGVQVLAFGVMRTSKRFQ